MMFALVAASSAIDALKALTSPKPPSGANKDAANLFAFQADASASTETASSSGAGKPSSISAETMSALLAMQSQSGLDASSSMRPGSLKEWFAKVDTDKDGKISKSEFEVLGADDADASQADDLFARLDKDGDGSVSFGELASALKGKGRHHRAERSEASDPLLQALDSSLNTTAANADASVTASASRAATSSYYFTDQLVPRQSAMIAAQTNSSLSVSV